MRRISLALLTAVLVLAGLFWFKPELRRAMSDRWDAWRQPPGSTESHKCRQGGKLSYSTQKCPPGSVEEGINGGTVTVVALPKPAAAPASTASLPTARDLLVKPDEPSLQDKRIERVMNQ